MGTARACAVPAQTLPGKSGERLRSRWGLQHFDQLFKRHVLMGVRSQRYLSHLLEATAQNC